jgi:hypothetical protein
MGGKPQQKRNRGSTQKARQRTTSPQSIVGCLPPVFAITKKGFFRIYVKQLHRLLRRLNLRGPLPPEGLLAFSRLHVQ